MLFELFLALIAGLIAGTITGLLPGIHINLVGAILVSLSIGILAPINPIFLVVFVVTMSITHTFTDFIPSVFLGCPDTDTALSVLPGHEMLKEGKGYEAIMLAIYGGLIAVFLLVLTSIPLVLFVERGYNLIKNFIPYVLIFVVLFMVLSERKKVSALWVILLTGVLGYMALNLDTKESLLPLLSGLFGASSLIISIKTKVKIPKQKISLAKPKFLKPILAAMIASPLCGFLPGLGSSQAATVGNTIIGSDKKGFLTLIGATNTLVMGFSFISLYTIHKVRTGSAATINNLIGALDKDILILIIATCLIVGIISFFWTSFLAKRFIKIFEKINYSKLQYLVLGFVTLVVILFSGFLGFIIFAVATLTGFYCISLGVRRTNMMACLLIPTIILYLF
ncbi:MAG: tripartite tricarboxylate transporter permease [Nanoarchaeota archaeon]